MACSRITRVIKLQLELIVIFQKDVGPARYLNFGSWSFASGVVERGWRYVSAISPRLCNGSIRLNISDHMRAYVTLQILYDDFGIRLPCHSPYIQQAVNQLFHSNALL